MAKDIKFNIKLQIDGKEHIVSASTGAKELAKQLGIAESRSKDFGSALLAINQKIEVFRTASGFISQMADSMRQVVQANTQVTQSTGLAGDEMLRLRNSVQAVSDYYGTGFSETLQAANALSKGFGITAEEAMRLYARRFLNAHRMRKNKDKYRPNKEIVKRTGASSYPISENKNTAHEKHNTTTHAHKGIIRLGSFGSSSGAASTSISMSMRCPFSGFFSCSGFMSGMLLP